MKVLLLLAIKHRLEGVVDHLCEVLGADLSIIDGKGKQSLCG